MNFRRTAIFGVAAVVALTSTGCATRQIDAEQTGSVPIEGTSWQKFCDGPNAFIWVPGHSGENDELEALVYDDEDCQPDSRFTQTDPSHGDADGIIEPEDEQ